MALCEIPGKEHSGQRVFLLTQKGKVRKAPEDHAEGVEKTKEGKRQYAKNEVIIVGSGSGVANGHDVECLYSASFERQCASKRSSAC